MSIFPVVHYILDENHEPVEIVVWDEHGKMDTKALVRWGKWYEVMENRVVKQEHVGPYFVSTVFLAMDHNWNPDRGPLLFETMVFDEEHQISSSFLPGRSFRESLPVQPRYGSWPEAVEGHAAMVARMADWLASANAQVEELREEKLPDL